ncbi:MAG: esterase family protein [Negativibacillus sp.]
MEKQYVKTYSRFLDRDMEFNVYGYGGKPCVVFPCQNGRFFDYENFQMTEIVRPWIEAGKLQLFCVDSIDGESWSDQGGDPRHRSEMQERWYNYIMEEFVPMVKEINGSGEKLMTTGCSMGATHSANFFFRRPDVFDAVIALSGVYESKSFFGDYMDELLYQNSPNDFLQNMPKDHYYIDLYNHSNIIICVGQGAWEDLMLESTHKLERILAEKGIHAWVDYWGYDVNHDWPWWKKQLPYFLGHVLGQP